MRSTMASASATVKCVSCGSSRSASRTRISTPSTRPNASARLERPFEDVCELAADRVPRLSIRIARDGPALQRVEAAQIVEAEDVIRMRVREEYGVDARNAVRQRLLPEINRRIDQEA